VFSIQLKKNGKSTEIFIWNTKKPLLIGTPFKWSIELTSQNKILIRNLNSPLDSLSSNEHTLLSIEEALENTNSDHALPVDGHYSITFKIKQDLKPAFIHQESKNKAIIGFEVFTVFGNIIQKSDPFYSNYTLQHKGKGILRIQK